MIEINLIPPEFKSKKKGFSIAQGLNIPPEVVVGVGGGLLILLVGVHFLLLSLNLVRFVERQALHGHWAQSASTKGQVDEVITKLRTLQGRQKAIEGMAGNGNLFWSQKLNIINDSVPRTVWLTKISLTNEMLFIEGSAVDKPNIKSGDIYTLISNLKKSKNFTEHFKEIKLGPIHKRLINNMEVKDFSITSLLK